MARVWLQQARYNTLINISYPKVRLLLKQLGDLGQPYQCDANGNPLPTDQSGNLIGTPAVFLGHDDQRLTVEDQAMFAVIRNLSAAELTTLKTQLTAQLTQDSNTDIRAWVVGQLQTKIDAQTASMRTGP